MAQRGSKPGSVAVVRGVAEQPQPPRSGLLGDRDRRRALLLSVLVHAGVLLAFMALSLQTPTEEPEKLVVLELTPPQAGAALRDAAAADEPAPSAPASQAAGNAANDVVTEQSASETQAPNQPSAEVPPALPLTPSEQAPEARLPRQQAAQNLPTQAPSSTLPEVEAPEVAPQPLEQAIALPTPEVEAELTPSQQLAVTPQVEVAEAQPLPQPEAAALIAEEPVVTPQAQAQVSPAAPLPQPQASVSIATRDVPAPQAAVSVAPAAPLPQPSVSSSVVVGTPLPAPEAAATVTPGQPLAITPGVQVGEAVPLATPEANATVTLPEPAAEAGAGGGAGNDVGDGAAAAADAGNAPRSGQAEDGVADAAGQGAAADASGVAETGVANVQNYEVSVDTPLAVLIDNADAAYPQQGLVEASGIFEMPVEGGLTRLMSVYTEGDPVQVGPIRSARDYFLEAALQLGGTLVHVGGAPSTVSRIASQNLVTVDALQQGALFAQAPDRLAPHSTFSTGAALRDAVGRLEQQVSGTLYAPPSTAPDVTSLNVAYSEVYSSGFRYLNDLDQYRWVRHGADATDTAGTAITADAVVVAQVTAFPYPDDPEGRLYLPYSGGPATLYLRGKAIAGGWTPERGFSFVADTGVPVDLRPFKTWILFAPEAAQVSVD